MKKLPSPLLRRRLWTAIAARQLLNSMQQRQPWVTDAIGALLRPLRAAIAARQLLGSMQQRWLWVIVAATAASSCSGTVTQVLPPDSLPPPSAVSGMPAGRPPVPDAPGTPSGNGDASRLPDRLPDRQAAPTPTADPMTPIGTTTVPIATGPAATGTTTTGPTSTTVPSKRWTLLAGGDTLMDRSEAERRDPFRNVRPALASADIALVNVEMAISERGRPANRTYVFRAPTSAAARMALAGIDAANLANNHAMDFGPDALSDSIAALESYGVRVVGAGADAQAAYRPRIIETRPGLQVALIGVTQIVPWGTAAGDDRPGVASAHERARVLSSVRSAAAQADAVVVTVHWGIERHTCPNDAQQSLARDLLAAGASAVIGHHPHVLQPVVAEDGHLVAYSLGNFAWHPRWGITAETGVLEIRFDGATVLDWTLHPHVLDADGAPTPAPPGSRYERISDIIAGDCARHKPAPLTTTTTTPNTADSETGSQP